MRTFGPIVINVLGVLGTWARVLAPLRGQWTFPQPLTPRPPIFPPRGI
jgi:hypothetical protein